MKINNTVPFDTIIKTAKANGHDAYHYLCYLFRELPKAKTEEAVNKLLPWNIDMTVTDRLMKERSS